MTNISQPRTPAEYTLLGVQVHKKVAKQREDQALRREIGFFTKFQTIKTTLHCTETEQASLNNKQLLSSFLE